MKTMPDAAEHGVHPAAAPPAGPVMTTRRLVMRPVTLADLDDFARLYADEAVVRFLGDGLPSDREASAAWLQRALAHWQKHCFGPWSVRLRDSGEFVGRCGLSVHELEHGTEVEVGYVLAAEHWRRGYATEAASAVRDLAIEQMGLTRLVSLIDADNQASARVAVALGMTYERQVRFGKRWSALGRLVDLYALDGGQGFSVSSPDPGSGMPRFLQE